MLTTFKRLEVGDVYEIPSPKYKGHTWVKTGPNTKIPEHMKAKATKESPDCLVWKIGKSIGFRSLITVKGRKRNAAHN